MLHDSLQDEDIIKSIPVCERSNSRIPINEM